MRRREGERGGGGAKQVGLVNCNGVFRLPSPALPDRKANFRQPIDSDSRPPVCQVGSARRAYEFIHLRLRWRQTPSTGLRHPSSTHWFS